MKRKGFTLIELLAVIVVLAIIALIATPIVMNTIKNAKKGAAERTADNYIKQVETAITQARIDGTKISDGEYTVDKDGNLTGNGLTEPITIEMSGTKPKGGRVEIKNGGVTTRTIALMDDYGVSYDTENNKYTAQELYKGVLCTKASGVDLNNLTYGNEFTCELGDNDKKTFYVLEINGDNISLIMNANVGKDGKVVTSTSTDNGLVSWCTKEDYLAAGGTESDWNKKNQIWGNNNLGPITVEKALKENTKTWTKLVSSQIMLPSAYQLSATVEDSKWNADSSGLVEMPDWLSDYLRNSKKNKVSSIEGYWTSTLYSSMGAWTLFNDGGLTAPMHNNGTLYGYYVSYTSIGIRPVITISKSNLS